MSSAQASTPPTTSDSDEYMGAGDMIEQPAGKGGLIGCTGRDSCDVDFVVQSVARINCDAHEVTDGQTVVRVPIEVEARQEIAYPDALGVFNLGSWSALTDDGYTLRSLDVTSNCPGSDNSLLMYGINAGEKIRNTIDFVVPTNVVKMQLQPAALEGGGWNWEIADQ